MVRKTFVVNRVAKNAVTTETVCDKENVDIEEAIQLTGEFKCYINVQYLLVIDNYDYFSFIILDKVL